MTLWDISRCSWLGLPEYLPDAHPVKALIQSRRFQRWGYFPIDSTGPNDRLTSMSRATLGGYDRILTPTRWAADLVKRSGTYPDVDWLPHGMNLGTFKPADRIESRHQVFPGVMDHDKLIGIVMTNQVRKDWGLTAQICAALKSPSTRFWWKTDIKARHWSLPALIADYGLRDHVILDDGEYNDDYLAKCYQACDLTILPSTGEGFGYPIVESLACGVPVIHCDYAGGAELIQEPEWKIAPDGWRLETMSNCVRPTFDTGAWIDAAEGVISSPPRPDDCVAMVKHLNWGSLWKVWQRWLLKGIV